MYINCRVHMFIPHPHEVALLSRKEAMEFNNPVTCYSNYEHVSPYKAHVIIYFIVPMGSMHQQPIVNLVKYACPWSGMAT